jgi:hypothetical protein
MCTAASRVPFLLSTYVVCTARQEQIYLSGEETRNKGENNEEQGAVTGQVAAWRRPYATPRASRDTGPASRRLTVARKSVGSLAVECSEYARNVPASPEFFRTAAAALG